MILITLYDNCHPLPHSEEMIDEWFRSLAPAEKVRLFWMEHETTPSDLGTARDEAFRAGEPASAFGDFLARREADAPRLPVPPFRQTGMLATIFAAGDNWYTVTLETACQLAGAGAIAERTSYSDDFDGAPASLYFEVVDDAAFAREMAALETAR